MGQLPARRTFPPRIESRYLNVARNYTTSEDEACVVIEGTRNPETIETHPPSPLSGDLRRSGRSSPLRRRRAMQQTGATTCLVVQAAEEHSTVPRYSGRHLRSIHIRKDPRKGTGRKLVPVDQGLQLVARRGPDVVGGTVWTRDVTTAWRT